MLQEAIILKIKNIKKKNQTKTSPKDKKQSYNFNHLKLPENGSPGSKTGLGRRGWVGETGLQSENEEKAQAVCRDANLVPAWALLPCKYFIFSSAISNYSISHSLISRKPAYKA